jgi:NAD dependent epimerase/dehydratase family enzyme
MSWITLDDVVSAVVHALATPSIAGACNTVAPGPVTNADFTRALAAALHRPALLPVPAFALRLAAGEMADAALLASCRAVPARLLASGFRFAHPEIGAALQAILT